LSISNANASLTQADIDRFIHEGYVKVPHALTPELAERCARNCLALAGIDENDPATLPELEMGRVSFERGPNNPDVVWYDMAEHAPRLWQACCELMGGPERVKQPTYFRDGGIIRLHDPNLSWQPPSPDAPGWHVDGGSWFTHYLDSPQQGLLLIILYRDCLPKGGGTFFATDSPAEISRFYAENPVGRMPTNDEMRAMLERCSGFAEITGQAGDAFLLHPFMLHTGSVNTRPGHPRIMENAAVSFREPMCFDREDPADYSVVERSILHHLGVERYAFVRRGEEEAA